MKCFRIKSCYNLKNQRFVCLSCKFYGFTKGVLFMKVNMRGPHRVIRFLFGAFILVVGYRTQNWLGLLGLIPLFTGVFGFCPLCCSKEGACESKK